MTDSSAQESERVRYTESPSPEGRGRSPAHIRRMPGVERRLAFQRTAATYSPTWWGSTIGDGELNFSVRNGKRWFLTAITAAIYDLREQTFGGPLPRAAKEWRIFLLEKVSRAISTGLLRPSPTLHILPINVVVSHDPQGKTHLEDGFALRCFQRLS